MAGRFSSRFLHLTLDDETLTEVDAERRRLGISRTALLIRVWEIARATIATYPAAAAPARRFRLRRRRPVVRARSWMVRDVEERAAEVFAARPEGRSTAEAIRARRPREPEPPPPPRPEPTTKRDRIVAVVLDAGRQVSLAEIYEAMGGVNRVTVRRLLRAARMDGLVEMVRPGLYKAPGAGPGYASLTTQVLALLAVVPRSIVEVKRALGVPHRVAKNQVKLARRRGFVERGGPGLYRLTQAGRDRIAIDAAAAAAGRYQMGGRGELEGKDKGRGAGGAGPREGQLSDAGVGHPRNHRGAVA